MRTLTTINAAACLATALALGGCGNGSDTPATPGEAITDRSAEPAPQSDVTERPAGTQPASEPALEADDPTTAGAETIHTVVIDSDGQQIGTLSVEPAAPGVRLALNVEGIPPGEHAVHFHEVGRCDPPDFQSAGGHFNPHGANHGMPDLDEDAQDADHHVGDMLNQTADDEGRIDSTIVNHIATLDDGPNTLLDQDGSAFVIHADPDDYESQPAGNAGARIACAVINRSDAAGSQPQT